MRLKPSVMIKNPKTTLLQITENIQHPNGGLGGRNAGVRDFRICQLLFPSEGAPMICYGQSGAVAGLEHLTFAVYVLHTPCL